MLRGIDKAEDEHQKDFNSFNPKMAYSNENNDSIEGVYWLIFVFGYAQRNFKFKFKSKNTAKLNDYKKFTNKLTKSVNIRWCWTPER